MRRDLVAINLALISAALVFGVGHIPGVINSATLIAAGSSLWAAFKLVSVVRRLLNPIATSAEAEPIDIIRTSTPHRIPAVRLVADASRRAS